MSIPRSFSSTLFVILLAFPALSQQPDYTLNVNPFIGSGGHGHTFPGAALPYGMVQLSPDTRTLGWDACSGYYNADSTILGFSHTHLSGTGIGDYGDILFTPIAGELKTGNNGEIEEYYSSGFEKSSEKATPGYYKVTLNPSEPIVCEMTATLRTGAHRYTYPSGSNASILVDLRHSIHDQKILESDIRIVNDHEICGMRLTEGWAKRHYIFFTAKFSKPFSACIYENNLPVAGKTFAEGSNIRIMLDFGSAPDQQVIAIVGISAVDSQGALKNMEAESPDFNFDGIRNSAWQEWNKYLSGVDVEGGTDDQRTIFYTGMYHAALQPNIFMDVDKRYLGQDMKTHTATGFINYTVFSLWDTFRAWHPLLTITNPSRDAEMIRCLLAKYQEGGFLPKWDLQANYTGTMIGDHAISVITDAYMKGIRNFDIDLAYKAVLRSSFYDTSGIIVHHPAIWEWLMPKAKYYNETLGFIPSDKELFAVSKALEIAYNNWCVAQLAMATGHKSDETDFLIRSERYNIYYDKVVGFMRGKSSKGEWVEPFNPCFSDHMNSPYCEGNAWQWSWFVPHNIDAMIRMMGGRADFIARLDSLFTQESFIEGENASADITGLIGQYAHGNEPSHHIAYLYNYAGQPYKTQECVDQILNTMYSNSPNGLAGNEDCGQMSAWYLISSMGFYQVCPGNPVYTIGRPLFDKVTIHLENGKTLVIKAENNSPINKYIGEFLVNGEVRKSPFFTHAEISNGGELSFKMQKEIN